MIQNDILYAFRFNYDNLVGNRHEKQQDYQTELAAHKAEQVLNRVTPFTTYARYQKE